MPAIEIPSNFVPFVDALKKKCKKNGIDLVLSPSKNVYTANDHLYPAGGFFDETTKSLVVACAMKAKIWMPTLVHESCHLDQYLEDRKKWDEFNHYISNLWEWLAGRKMLNSLQVRHVKRKAIEFEYDCEKRSLIKIKDFKLDINVSDYCKRANNCLYAYHLIERYKIYPNGVDSKQIYQHAKSYLLKDISNTTEKHKIAVNNFYNDLVISQEKERGNKSRNAFVQLSL